MGDARFATCRAIVNAFADEPIETFDREAAPRDASRQNNGTRPDDVVTVEVNLARCRIDAGNRARDQDLRSESPGLLKRTASELVARNATGKPEIVLDPRGRPGLTAWRLALDH